jgi:hypothetical protein
MPDGRSIGLGLFARTNKPLPAALLQKLKSGEGTPEEKKKYLVFEGTTERPVFIGTYKGETVTKTELDGRYDYTGADGKTREQTAPYGVTQMRKKGKRRTKLLDSLCQRNFVSYSNDARGTDFHNNAVLKTNLQLVATHHIWQGEEILWDYGDEYWNHDLAKVQFVRRSTRIRNRSRRKRA